ncbi:unnamed protein product [Rotaria sp. Silwood2]|nr:unnamed protein product [Rotaria sp. Silwood2]
MRIFICFFFSVILGTTAEQLIIMHHHGNTIEIISLSTQSIKQLIYSCNKFYPKAPDNNATKFVNDDYMLVGSLENEQILFLNNYQDQSSIVVDTKLQNIKIDWSSSGEILAIGGHKRLKDINYTNQIIIYTRRGEILCRVYIPQTVYRSTTKGSLPERKTLCSFPRYPLKSHLCLQYTMKRIDNKIENSSTKNNLSGAIYILSLEFLGDLISLLTAKRISKICPDFITYDSQIKTNDLSSSLSKINSSKITTKKDSL